MIYGGADGNRTHISGLYGRSLKNRTVYFTVALCLKLGLKTLKLKLNDGGLPPD